MIMTVIVPPAAGKPHGGGLRAGNAVGGVEQGGGLFPGLAFASATFAVIPMIPERAAVLPTLRTARLCTDHKVPYRVVINMADPLRGAGPVESAWGLLDGLEGAAHDLVRAPLRGAQPGPARRPDDHRLPR